MIERSKAPEGSDSPQKAEVGPADLPNQDALTYSIGEHVDLSGFIAENSESELNNAAVESGDNTPEVKTPTEKLEAGFESLAGAVKRNEEEIKQYAEDAAERHDSVESMKKSLERMERLIAESEARIARRFKDIEAMITLLSNGDIPAGVKSEAADKAQSNAPEGPVYGTYDKDAIEDADVDDLVSGADTPKPTSLADGEVSEPGKEVSIRETGSELVAGEVEAEAPNPLEVRLQEASDRYAELTAKKRNGYVGRLLETPPTGRLSRAARFLAKITGVKKIAEKINGRTDEELNTAREEYESAIGESQKAIAMAMRAEKPEAGPELAREIHHNTADFLSQVDVAFEEKLMAERMASSKKTNRFVNWWVKQDGLGGKLKKLASVAGVGLATGGTFAAVGAVTGAFFLPGVGAGIGAIAGAYVGHHVTKRRANAVVEGGKTLAERQSAEDLATKRAAIEENKAGDTYKPNPDTGVESQIVVDSNSEAERQDVQTGPAFVVDKDALATGRNLTSLTEARTTEELRRNRSRVRTAAAVGGIAGGSVDAVQGAVDFAQSMQNEAPVDGSANSRFLDSIRSSIDTANGSPDAAATPDAPVGAVEPQPPLIGDPASPTSIEVPAAPGPEFVVEQGSGLIRELQQFAEASGHNISGQNAEGLYNALVERFGVDNLIDVTNQAQDVYQMSNGGTGISGPGAATWRPGVADFANNWLTSQGL